MSAPVFVAGIGIISAIGDNIAENLAALETGREGMSDITYLETLHKNKLPVAEIKWSNDQLAEKAGLSNQISRTALLSTIAAQEAIHDAGIENFSSLRTGFISANSVGGMDKTENFFNEFLRDNQKG